MSSKMPNLVTRCRNTASFNVIPIKIVNGTYSNKYDVMIDTVYMLSLLPAGSMHRIKIVGPVNANYTPVNGTGTGAPILTIYNDVADASTGLWQYLGSDAGGTGTGITPNTNGTPSTYSVKIGEFVRTATNTNFTWDFYLQYYNGSWATIGESLSVGITDPYYLFDAVSGLNFKTIITKDANAVISILYRRPQVGSEPVTFAINGATFVAANGNFLSEATNATTVYFSGAELTAQVSYKLVVPEQLTDSVNVNDQVTLTIERYAIDLTENAYLDADGILDNLRGTAMRIPVPALTFSTAPLFESYKLAGGSVVPLSNVATFTVGGRKWDASLLSGAVNIDFTLLQSAALNDVDFEEITIVPTP